jgi:hypothetical protein
MDCQMGEEWTARCERNRLPRRVISHDKATQDQRGVRGGEGRKDENRCGLSIL